MPLQGSTTFRGLFLVYVAVFLSGLSSGAARVAVARVLRIELGLPVVVVASFTTWFMVGRALSSTVTGFAADRWPGLVRFAVWVPVLVSAAIVYCLATSASPVAVLGLAAAWGLVNGVAWPMVQLLTSSLAGAWSATAMSLYFSLGGAGTAIGQFLYGLLPLGDRGIIAFSSLIILVSGLVLLTTSPYAKTLAGRLRGRRRGWRFTRPRGVEVWVLVAALAAGFTGGVLSEFLYVYLSEVYGLDRSGLSLVLGGSGAVSLAASLLVGPLADRLGVVPVLRAVLVSGSLGLIMLTIPGSMWAALAAVGLARIASRSSLPLTRNAAVFAPERRASLLGLSNTLSNIGQMVGPLLAGWLYDTVHGSVGPLDARGLGFIVAAALMLLVAAFSPRGREG